MSNNLKEEINDLIGECIMRALEDNGETVNGLKTIQPETTEAILALINQKEKEAEVRGLENLLDGSAEGATCICESAGLSVCDHNWSLCNVVRDRIKQLKEELNKKGK